jgi:2,3-diaminopropionate biosynthesis protein SbnB
MKYLNESSIKTLGVDWDKTVEVINNTVELLRNEEFSQPVKPYLRYKDLKNRIIAMPAYIGGVNGTAGIKWIASFPDNIKRNEKRAHATVILNNEETGKPYSIINTGLISAIRTVAVTGFMLQKYFNSYPHKEKVFNVGIIGYGPVGQTHLDMLCRLVPKRIGQIFIYDLKGVEIREIPEAYREKTVLVRSWEEVFHNTEIFITCTVADDRYIDIPPKKGTLHLNVSLRDYCAGFMKDVDLMIVDDWEEVCRENTDIEYMYLKHGLTKDDVFCVYDPDLMDNLSELENKVVMFNPMGMAVFDLAISNYYYRLSLEQNIGIDLPE